MNKIIVKSAGWVTLISGYGLLGYTAITGEWLWFALTWIIFSCVGSVLEACGWLNVMWNGIEEHLIMPSGLPNALHTHITKTTTKINWRDEGF